MNSIQVWVNRSITHPNVIDGVYTDHDYAVQDRMSGFETVEATVVSKELLGSVQDRLSNIQTGLEVMSEERQGLEATLSRMAVNLTQIQAEMERMKAERETLKCLIREVLCHPVDRLPLDLQRSLTNHTI